MSSVFDDLNDLTPSVPMARPIPAQQAAPPGFYWNQKTGELLPLPTGKSGSILPWILSGIMATVLIGGALGWAFWPESERDSYRPSVNPIDQYFTTYTDGNYELWTETLKRFDANEFPDRVSMSEFQAAELTRILNEAEADSIKALDSTDGKLWVAQTPEQKDEVRENRAEARKVIKSFVDGYRKWKR